MCALPSTPRPAAHAVDPLSTLLPHCTPSPPPSPPPRPSSTHSSRAYQYCSAGLLAHQRFAVRIWSTILAAAPRTNNAFLFSASRPILTVSTGA